MPSRPTVTFRINRTDIDSLDQRARAESVERSEMIRRLLAYAVRMMPKGWRP